MRPYNLGTQERIVRGRMPTMELINERFARYLRIGLFNYMHRNTEVSVGPIRVQKYAEFVRNLVVPTNLNLVTAKPMRGTGLVVFDPNLVFLVMDNMFGGDGRFHTRVEGRDFTPTEQRIIQGMLNVVFTEYAKAWAPVFKLEFEYVRSEMNSQFANIATPSEIVIATTFSLEMGGAQAEMHVCFRTRCSSRSVTCSTRRCRATTSRPTDAGSSCCRASCRPRKSSCAATWEPRASPCATSSTCGWAT